MGDKMLLKFGVENYKGFKDKIEIDFGKTRDYKYNLNCLNKGVINKAIVFGNNAAGKSNLGFAIFDIVGTLTDKPVDREQTTNYINADSDSLIAKFYYDFKFGNDTLTYNYFKSDFRTIVFEELYINNEKIYDYDFIQKKLDFKFKKKVEAETLNFEFYEANMSLLRYIANNTIQSENSLIRQLMQFVNKMLWFRSLKDNRFIGLDEKVTTVSEWIVNKNLVAEFKMFIKEFADVNLDLDSIQVSNNNLLIEKHKKFPVLFETVASSGISALIIYFYWYKKFNDITFLFIDEFDAFYHFNLSEKIIKNLLNYTNMQTVLTSHNTFVASNELLRPDCYFILNNGKLISFADTTDREIRQGHNIEKMMRQGEFSV